MLSGAWRLADERKMRRDPCAGGNINRRHPEIKRAGHPFRLDSVVRLADNAGG
jgi:hypothetical protein